MVIRSAASLLPAELPAEVLHALQTPGTRKMIRFCPRKGGEEETEGALYEFPSLSSPDGKRLLLSLGEEHSEAGCLLVESLWYDIPAEILLSGGGRLLATAAAVFRCHIAGPLFGSMLEKARASSPDADIACVFELHAGAWASLPAETPDPCEAARKPAGSGLFRELHLDHPDLKSLTGND